MDRQLAEFLLLSLLSLSPQQPLASVKPSSGIFEMQALDASQIDALDRARTAIILPVGMLEEHGPHLPIGTDSIWLRHTLRSVVVRLRETLPDWNIVTMPFIEYGEGGANGLSGNPIHPGTYAIRQSTLRDLVADIGDQLAQNRFKWIFVLSHHLSPRHHVAITQACDFVSQTAAVSMMNLGALVIEDEELSKKDSATLSTHYSQADLSSLGVDLHAGHLETSFMLALQPDAVRPIYKSLAPQVGWNLQEFGAVARKPAWPGYFGAPARANPALGRALSENRNAIAANLAVRAIRGEDLTQHRRHPDGWNPDAKARAELEIDDARDRAFQAKLQEWLVSRRRSR